MAHPAPKASEDIVAKRVMPGCYSYTRGPITVMVEDRDPNPDFGDTSKMWCAIRKLEGHYITDVSDPVRTKREAVRIARMWLTEPEFAA